MSAIVTAIIPNYNHASFLERRLQSVYGQTYPHLRVILLDDASTDDSRAILETYRSHPRTQAIVYNDVNSGSPFAQWQKGLEMVETDWVWIAESDDWCSTAFLMLLQPAMVNEAVVLAYNDIKIVTENGSILWCQPEAESKIWNGEAFLKEKLVKSCAIANAGMAIFRKSRLNFDWSIFASFRYCPDYYFWCQVVLRGMVYSSGKAMAYFVRHEREFTHGKVGSILDQQEHIKILSNLLEQEVLTPTDVIPAVKHKLIEKACVKKARTPEILEAVYGPWIMFWKSYKIPVKQWEIDCLALRSKFMHRFNTMKRQLRRN